MKNRDRIFSRVDDIESAMFSSGIPEWIAAVRAWMALYREADGTAFERDVELIGLALKQQDPVVVRSHLYVLRGGRLTPQRFQDIHKR